MRTDRYRHVEWAVPETDFVEYELCVHLDDPGETKNIANAPEHGALLGELSAMLHADWRGALHISDY